MKPEPLLRTSVSPDVRMRRSEAAIRRDGRHARLHGAGALERREGFRCFRCLCSRSDSPRDGRWGGSGLEVEPCCAALSQLGSRREVCGRGGYCREIAPPSRRWFLASAAAAVLAVISGVATYKTTTAPSESVRLAMLPFESGSETLSREIASQLVSVKGSQKTRLTVIPFSQVLRNHVDTPEKASVNVGRDSCTARNDSEYR